MSAIKPLLATTVTLALPGICWAGPTDKAIVAAMKLAEKPNYSWVTTVMDDAQAYSIEGKTKVADGWTWVRLPMIRSVAKRLGDGAGSELEALFKGNTSSVIRTSQGWQTFKELPWWEPVMNDELDDWQALQMSRPVGRMPLQDDPFSTDPLAMLPPPPPPRMVNPEDFRPYTNAQYGVSRPHEELAIIVSSYTDLKVSGDTVTGTLSDLGAQLLLVQDGQDKISPVVGAGIFKLIIKDGIVASYMLRLEGVLQVGKKKRVLVRQTSNTVLKNVGSTVFDVPEEARRKLGP